MIHHWLHHQIESICSGLTSVPRFSDLEILKCQVYRKRRVFHISLVVDREGGVDANLCEAVSRYVEGRIEALPEPAPLFTLEVASAGVERPLLTPAHYRRFVGKTINAITTLRLKNRTEFTGEIAGADDNAVTLDDKDAGLTALPNEVIKRAHLVYDPRTDFSRKGERRM